MDEQRRKELLELNQKLVRAVAKYYAKNEEDIERLVIAGNKGLIMAVNSFDKGDNYHFMGHAIWYIKRAIELELTKGV